MPDQPTVALCHGGRRSLSPFRRIGQANLCSRALRMLMRLRSEGHPPAEQSQHAVAVDRKDQIHPELSRLAHVDDGELSAVCERAQVGRRHRVAFQNYVSIRFSVAPFPSHTVHGLRQCLDVRNQGGLRNEVSDPLRDNHLKE